MAQGPGVLPPTPCRCEPAFGVNVQSTCPPPSHLGSCILIGQLHIDWEHECAFPAHCCPFSKLIHQPPCVQRGGVAQESQSTLRARLSLRNQQDSEAPCDRGESFLNCTRLEFHLVLRILEKLGKIAVVPSEMICF